MIFLHCSDAWREGARPKELSSSHFGGWNLSQSSIFDSTNHAKSARTCPEEFMVIGGSWVVRTKLLGCITSFIPVGKQKTFLISSTWVCLKMGVDTKSNEVSFLSPLNCFLFYVFLGGLPQFQKKVAGVLRPLVQYPPPSRSPINGLI